MVGSNSERIDAVRDALEDAGTRCGLQHVAIGQNTLSYLRRQGTFRTARVPDLILFDVVVMTAQAVATLKRIREEPNLQSTPVVLLTEDNDAPPSDVLGFTGERYTTFAPVELDSFLSALNATRPGRFMQAISLLEDFGFVVVRMPARSARSSAKSRMTPVGHIAKTG